jgi:hypothetical protein
MAILESIRKLAQPDEACASEAQFFEYLDLLRDSGVTNMFGAVPYLVRDFGLSRPAATKVLGEWMREVRA